MAHEKTMATQTMELPDEQTLVLMGDEASATLADADAFVERFGTAYELTGQIKASSFFRKTADVSALLLLRQIKESKLYRGMRVVVEDNGTRKSLTVGSFEEYCDLCLGMSVSKIKEDLQNLAALGEEFYAASQKMGLTYRQLRMVRGLPENERDEVKKLAEAKDFDALKDILYQQMDETAKYKKEIEKRDGELQDKDSLYEKAVKKQHEAEIKLERFIKLMPDEQLLEKEKAAREKLKELHQKGLELMGLWAVYHADARAIQDAEDAGPGTLDALAALTSAMCVKMADDLQESGIQVDFRRTFYPDHLVGDADYAALRGNNTVSEGNPDVPASSDAPA